MRGDRSRGGGPAQHVGRSQAIRRVVFPTSGSAAREFHDDPPRPRCWPTSGVRVTPPFTLATLAPDGSARVAGIVGRYAIYGKIASGGMASVHFGRLLGAAGLLAHGRHQAPAPAPRRGPRVRLDDHRRGAPRRAHPPPQRRADARRRRRRRRAPARHGVRARRVARAPAQGGERARAARPAADRERHRRSARSTASTPRTRPRASAARRSASSTATCRRRTSSSASTAWRASSTSASPRRPGACRRRARARSRARSRTWRPSSSRARRGDARGGRLRDGGRALGECSRASGSSRATTTRSLVRAGARGREGAAEPLHARPPRALDALVMRALALDPADRFASAQEMAEVLLRVVPPAFPTDVGTWVEEVAREALARAARSSRRSRASSPGDDRASRRERVRGRAPRSFFFERRHESRARSPTTRRPFCRNLPVSRSRRRAAPPSRRRASLARFSSLRLRAFCSSRWVRRQSSRAPH